MQGTLRSTGTCTPICDRLLFYDVTRDVLVNLTQKCSAGALRNRFLSNVFQVWSRKAYYCAAREMTNVAVLLFLLVVHQIECLPWLFGNVQQGMYPENIADLRSAKSQKHVSERLQSSEINDKCVKEVIFHKLKRRLVAFSVSCKRVHYLVNDEPELHQLLDTDKKSTNSHDKLIRKSNLLSNDLPPVMDSLSMYSRPSYVTAFLGLLGRPSANKMEESFAPRLWKNDMFRSMEAMPASSKFAKLNPANWFSLRQEADVLGFEKHEAMSRHFDNLQSERISKTDSSDGTFLQKLFRFRPSSDLKDTPIAANGQKTTTISDFEDVSEAVTLPSTTVSDTEDVTDNSDTKLSLEPGSIGVYILELLGGFATLIQGAILQIANGGSGMKPGTNPLDI